MDTLENDTGRTTLRQSPRKKVRTSQTNNNQTSASNLRHSNRKIIKQTKSRITFMCMLLSIV